MHQTREDYYIKWILISPNIYECKHLMSWKWFLILLPSNEIVSSSILDWIWSCWLPHSFYSCLKILAKWVSLIQDHPSTNFGAHSARCPYSFPENLQWAKTSQKHFWHHMPHGKRASACLFYHSQVLMSWWHVQPPQGGATIRILGGGLELSFK